MQDHLLVHNNENSKKKQTIIFLLVLILFFIPFIQAVTFENGTIIKNNCLGYNFTLQENLTVTSLVINSTCAGDTNNITAFFSPINLSIKNTNASGDGEIQLFGLTDALIHNSTSICNGSNSNTNSNDGNVNITLKQAETCFVLDEFNLTEGDIRNHNPLWFSSSTSTQKNIASNLTETINSTIVFDAVSCSISSVTYVSDSGAISYSPAFTCSNNMITIPLLDGIEQSTGSNIITIVYSSINNGGGGGGGSGGDTKVNNSFVDPILIEMTNLNNSFIYQSNGTIFTYLNGNLNITLQGEEYFYLINYPEILNFNENSGTIAHDTSGNGNDGTIDSATWNDDGIDITLTELIDYILSPTTGLFTIINNDYQWAGLDASWNYQIFGESCSVLNTTDLEEGFNAFVIGIITFLGVLGIIIGIVWLISYLKPLFSKEDGIQAFASN